MELCVKCQCAVAGESITVLAKEVRAYKPVTKGQPVVDYLN